MHTAHTAHTADCSRVFKRYDLRCPRCQELAAGHPARAGWSRPVPVPEGIMRAIIHPHTPTKFRPTQQWAAYDAQGRALGFAHNLEKLTAYLIACGYEITHSTCTHS